MVVGATPIQKTEDFAEHFFQGTDRSADLKAKEVPADPRRVVCKTKIQCAEVKTFVPRGMGATTERRGPQQMDQGEQDIRVDDEKDCLRNRICSMLDVYGHR